MQLSDLDYQFPAELLAQTPQRPSRVMWVDDLGPQEITIQDLIHKIPSGDILVLNDTKVLKRRIFADDLEILFLNSNNSWDWEVLFPAKKIKIGQRINLPRGVEAELISKGRPQVLRTNRPLTEEYFQNVAELPLPPYIQKARGQRHTSSEDEIWYQTVWAAKPGSFAAPTASLHFAEKDIAELVTKGVIVEKVTLHVGLGTFLPVTVENLNQHEMHAEEVEISAASWDNIQKAKKRGQKIWVLGTTSARALESAAQNLIPKDSAGFRGSTQLLIQPGFEFQIVDRLLTNFHQPQSTILALVAAFENLDKVKACYSWAIERRFRLFSYGDLSVWTR